mgnify:CR=1 FL=1
MAGSDDGYSDGGQRQRRVPRARIARNSKYNSFFRQQVRWALSCHRRFRKLGIPALYREMDDVFPDGYLVEKLNEQDITNFLKGTESQDQKIQIFVEYIEKREPSYARTFTKDGLARQFGDLLQRVAFDPRLTGIDNDKALEACSELDGATYSMIPLPERAEGNGEESEERLELKEYELNSYFVAFRKIGGTPHLMTIFLSIALVLKIDPQFFLPSMTGNAEKHLILGLNRYHIGKQLENIDFATSPFEDVRVGLSVVYPYSRETSWLSFCRSIVNHNETLSLDFQVDDDKRWESYSGRGEKTLLVARRYFSPDYDVTSIATPHLFARCEIASLDREIAKISWSL